MLYIMRHGRTDWNEMHRMQGQTDIPLNDCGRDMAENARDLYKDIHFDICFCSPLTRARETAEIFLKDRDIPIIYDDRLIEMCFGIYEGTANCFEIPDCPIKVMFLEPEKYTTPAEGAESFDELFARTGDFLEKTAKPLLNEGKDILIIGHGAMNSSIVCQVKNLPIKDFWSQGIENCKLMRLI